jgi:predicted transcriptional regulator
MSIQSIPVRVDGELREKLQAAADRDRRPLSAMIRILLSDAVAPRSNNQQQETSR